MRRYTNVLFPLLTRTLMPHDACVTHEHMHNMACAVARCLSVCHILVLHQYSWTYRGAVNAGSRYTQVFTARN